MNAGCHPEGMTSHRRDLIAGLEELGFDVSSPAAWRDDLSDDELAQSIRNLTAQEPLP